MKEKRLIWQLYPSYVLVVIISLALALVYATNSFESFYLNQVTSNLKSQTILIESQVLPYIDASSYSELTVFLSQQKQRVHSRFTVMNSDGDILADSDEHSDNMDNHLNRPEVIQALSNHWGSSIRYSDTLKTNMMYMAKPLLKQGAVIGVIRSAIPINELDNTLWKLKKKIGLWGICISLFSAFIGFVVSKTIQAPLKALTEGADEFSKGNFNFRLGIPKIKEFRVLAEALNTMAFQLSDRMNTIIKQANEKEAILSTMVEGIVTVDKHAHVTSINQSAMDYFCKHHESVIGSAFSDVIDHDDLYMVVTSALTSAQLIETDIVVTFPKERFLHVHGLGLQNPNGECNGALLVIHDITQLRRLEAVRKEFVANVSHELKTPVTLIKGFLETLINGAGETKKERDEFLAITQAHTHRLETIIEDLLSLSRLEQSGFKDTILMKEECLNDVIMVSVNTCRELALSKQSDIQFNASEMIYSSINRSLMEQALFNIIDNALKYSPPQSLILITLVQSENDIIISIEDQGCGISQEHIPHVFERFYRVDRARSRDVGGTGLGLSIVKHIMQVHNGFVAIDSVEGKGSVFTLTLLSKKMG